VSWGCSKVGEVEDEKLTARTWWGRDIYIGKDWPMLTLGTLALRGCHVASAECRKQCNFQK
jgi:hypothetical protein